MRAKRILCTLIAVMMTAAVFGVHVTVAEAEEITEVTAVTEIDPAALAVAGSPVNCPSFTTTSPGSAAVDNSLVFWERNGMESSPEIFYEGTWKLWAAVVIDGTNPMDTLSDSVKLTVNGKPWILDTVSHRSGDDPCEVAWFICPDVFTVTGGPLTFTKDVNWDIGQSVRGVPIPSFNVSAGAGGGKKPYKFTKLFGPSWISVSEDGTVSGTNSTYGINQMLGIQVTDDNGDTATITLDVALTKKDDREDIGYVEISWPTLPGMLHAGQTVSSSGQSVISPDTVKIQTGYWTKYDPETGEFPKIEDGETFGPGAYQFHLSVYADGEKYLMTAPELSVNTEPWILSEAWHSFGKEGADFTSDVYTICQSVPTVTVSGVTPPVSGSPLTTAGLSVSTEGAYVGSAHWTKYDPGTGTFVVCDGDEPQASETYYLELDIKAKELYAFDSAVHVRVGEYEPPTVQTTYLGDDRLFVRCPIQKADTSEALYVVIAGGLNVRAAASATSQRVGGLVFGDGCRALAQSGEWVYIKHGDLTGWVLRQYLALTYSEDTAIKPEYYTVTAGALNVRSGPSTDYPRIGGYTEGKKVLITGRINPGTENEWLVTDYLGELGFMMAKYAQGESAEEDNSIVKFSLDFSFPEDPSGAIHCCISTADSVTLTDDNFYLDEGGILCTLIYPDDAMNFRSLTEADITVPEETGLRILEIVPSDDGSITLRFVASDFEVAYAFTEGAGASWTKGSGKDLQITVKRNIDDSRTFGLFDGIYMDGTEVDPACYTAAEGSLNAVIGSSYLESLSAGEHVLEVRFSDGLKAVTAFKVILPPAGGSTQPSTGVGSFSGLYMLLSLFALMAAVSAGIERRRGAKR
ncbi:MAG: SH3 domain-containing protein [Eubacteriales bacterium]|nr:SH3 domain-containing protein [Eubacteriales bacterium]